MLFGGHVALEILELRTYWHVQNVMVIYRNQKKDLYVNNATIHIHCIQCQTLPLHPPHAHKKAE